MKRIVSMVWGMFWLILLGLPVAFLFADPGTLLPEGPLTSLYDSAVAVLGERVARISFCAAWLALDVALFWRFVVSRDKARGDIDPVDLHDWTYCGPTAVNTDQHDRFSRPD